MKNVLANQEWTLMDVLWEHGPCFLSDIMTQTEDKLGWTRNTYMSHLKDMAKAGYISWETVRGSRRYSASLSRQECARMEGRSLLARMERDMAGLFVMNMVQDADLSVSELEDMRRLIDDLSHQKGGKE